jgi:cobalt-zinc-cadmium resistance protein CzcA
MQSLIRTLLRYRNVVLIIFAATLVIGGYAFTRLDIEAYPDPSPPMVEFITQNPSWSAEEMEQQVTIPLETGLNGTPALDQIRSISIFGLSDVKMYFAFDSDYFVDRQEALNRIAQVTLPNNLQPQLSPESPVGEIYRYQLTGPGYSLNELKATQDWLLVREIKQVPGIIDVATFGGTTRQYQAEVDPNKLLTYGVTMTQVVSAVQNSNANAGGNYLTIGSQSVNVRGIGLLHSIDDMRNIVVAERNGVPVLLSDVAEVREGSQPRLGKVGRDNKQHDDPDIVEGIVLLQKGAKSLPALAALRQKISTLNHGNLLPPGMHISTIYDRTHLIDITTETVRHIVIMGLMLVTLVLLSMLGDWRITLIAAVTIPFAVLFAFSLMVLTGQSANLISIGAIDFGILVDASIVVLESVYRRVSRRVEGEEIAELILAGVADAARPVLFATLIILVAFIPLFTMQGVPGKIFAPMSVTYLRADLRAGTGLAGRSKRDSPRRKGDLAERLLPPPLRQRSGPRSATAGPDLDSCCNGTHRFRNRLSFCGGRIHACAGRRQPVDPGRHAAGHLLPDIGETGGRYPRDAGGISGDHAGGFADGASRRWNRRQHFQQH